MPRRRCCSPTDCPGHRPVSADGSGPTPRSSGGGTHTQWVSRTVSWSVFPLNWILSLHPFDSHNLLTSSHPSAWITENKRLSFSYVILKRNSASLNCCVFNLFSLNDCLVIHLINLSSPSTLTLLLLLVFSSLSPPVLPCLSRTRELFVPALSVALVGFSLHLTVCSIFAHRHGYRVDTHQVPSRHLKHL